LSEQFLRGLRKIHYVKQVIKQILKIYYKIDNST